MENSEASKPAPFWGRAIARVLYWGTCIFGYPAYLLWVIAFLSGIAAVFVGAWDFLVWLFNAGWRTTNFVFPIGAGIIAVALGIVGAGLNLAAHFMGFWAVAFNTKLEWENDFCVNDAIHENDANK